MGALSGPGFETRQLHFFTFSLIHQIAIPMNKQILFGLLLIIISGLFVFGGAAMKLSNYAAAGIFLNIGIIFWLVTLLYFGVVIVLKLVKPSGK